MTTHRSAPCLGDLVAEAFDLAEQITRDPSLASKVATALIFEALAERGRPIWRASSPPFGAELGADICLALDRDYATCPKCARHYGKNQVDLFAQVS